MTFIEKRMEQRGQGGFTLIELLVVIAILAILAGVVVFAVGQSTNNAEKAACETERAALLTAIEAANVANVSGYSSGESAGNYLENIADLEYFTYPGSGSTAARTNTAVADTTTCPAIT